MTLAKDCYKQIVFPHFVPQNILLGGGGSVAVWGGVVVWGSEGVTLSSTLINNMTRQPGTMTLVHWT